MGCVCVNALQLTALVIWAFLQLHTKTCAAAGSSETTLRRTVGSRARFGTSPSNFGSESSILSRAIKENIEVIQSNDNSLSSNDVVSIKRLSTDSFATPSKLPSATVENEVSDSSYRRRLNYFESFDEKWNFNETVEFVDGGFYFGNKASTRNQFPHIAITPLQKTETDLGNLEDTADLTVVGDSNIEKLKYVLNIENTRNIPLRNVQSNNLVTKWYLQTYLDIDAHCTDYYTTSDSGDFNLVQQIATDTKNSKRYPIAMLKLQAVCRNKMAAELKQHGVAFETSDSISELHYKLIEAFPSTVLGGYENLHNTLLTTPDYRGWRGVGRNESVAPNFLSIVHQCAKLNDVFVKSRNSESRNFVLKQVQFLNTGKSTDPKNFRWRGETSNIDEPRDKDGNSYPENSDYAPCTDENGKIPVWAMPFPKSLQSASENSFNDGKCTCGGDPERVCSGFQYCHAWRDISDTVVKAFCDFSPRCDASGTVDFTDDLIDAATGNVVCGLVLRGLHYDKSNHVLETKTDELGSYWHFRKTIDTEISYNLRYLHYLVLLARLNTINYYNTGKNHLNKGYISEGVFAAGELQLETYCKTHKFVNDDTISTKVSCPGDISGLKMSKPIPEYLVRLRNSEFDFKTLVSMVIESTKIEWESVQSEKINKNVVEWAHELHSYLNGESLDFVDQCVCANSLFTDRCNYATQKQYCLAQDGYENPQSGSTMCSDTQFSVNSYTPLSIAEMWAGRHNSSVNNRSVTGKLCSSRACVPVKSNVLLRHGGENFTLTSSPIPQCPLKAKFVSPLSTNNGTFEHGFEHCVCDNKICNKNEYCYEDKPEKCYPKPLCTESNTATTEACVCNPNKAGHFCNAGQVCASFHTQYSTVTDHFDGYKCFDVPVAKCSDESGRITSAAACYCGAVTPSKPVCGEDHFCSFHKATGDYRCTENPPCQNILLNLPNNEICYCPGNGMCDVGKYCYEKVELGDNGTAVFGCSASAPSVPRLTSTSLSLQAERGAVINKTRDWADIVVGCRDISACNYNKDAQHQPDDDSCTYPETGKDCAGNCIIQTVETYTDADGFVYNLGSANCISQFPPHQLKATRYDLEYISDFHRIDFYLDEGTEGKNFRHLIRTLDARRQIFNSRYLTVPETAQAKTEYGCPVNAAVVGEVDFSKACNKLYNSTNIRYEDYWMYQFCILPPPQTTCKYKDPETWNNNYLKSTSTWGDLFSCDEDYDFCTKHYDNSCDQTKCGYHPDPSSITQNCSAPETGKTCQDTWILGEERNIDDRAVEVTCSTSQTMQVLPVLNSHKYQCLAQGKVVADSKALVDLYEYFDEKHNDHFVDSSGLHDRRRLELIDDNAFVSRAVDLVRYHSSSGILQSEQLGSDSVPNAYKDYVLRKNRFDTKQQSSDLHHALLNEYKTDATKFWTERGAGVPPENYFKNSEFYGDDFFYEPDFKIRLPMQFYNIVHGEYGYTVEKVPGFWKRAFARESNTLAVEWFARQSVAKHIHSPPFAEQVMWHNNNAASQPLNLMHKNLDRSPVVNGDVEYEKLEKMTLPNKKYACAYDPRVSAVHQNEVHWSRKFGEGEVVEDFLEGTVDNTELAAHHDAHYKRIFGKPERSCEVDVLDQIMWEYADGYDYENKVKITQVNYIKAGEVRGGKDGGFFDVTSKMHIAKEMHTKERWIYFDGDWIEWKTGGGKYSNEYYMPDRVDFSRVSVSNSDYILGPVGSWFANNLNADTEKGNSQEYNSFMNWMNRRYTKTPLKKSTEITYSMLNGKTKSTNDTPNTERQALHNDATTVSQRKFSGATKCNKRCIDNNYFASMFELDLTQNTYKEADSLVNSMVWQSKLDPEKLITYGECFCYKKAHAFMSHHFDTTNMARDTGYKESNKDTSLERMIGDCEDAECKKNTFMPHHAYQFLKIDRHFTDVKAKDKKRKDQKETWTNSLHQSSLRVGYTFSCEAGTYYRGGLQGRGKFMCAFCPVGKFSLENYPVTRGNSEESAAPECEVCPVGSQAVTLTYYGYRAYVGSDKDKDDSHASMCKHCPNGWSDARDFGQSYTEGCVNLPAPRMQHVKFTNVMSESTAESNADNAETAPGDHPCKDYFDTGGNSNYNADNPCDSGWRKHYPVIPLEPKHYANAAAENKDANFTRLAKAAADFLPKCPYGYEPDMSYYTFDGDNFTEPEFTPFCFGEDSVTTEENCTSGTWIDKTTPAIAHCVPCGKGTHFHPAYGITGYPWCARCAPGKYNPRHNHRISIGRNVDSLGPKELQKFTYRSPIGDAHYAETQSAKKADTVLTGEDKNAYWNAVLCKAHISQNPIVKSFTRGLSSGRKYCELTALAFISDYDLYHHKNDLDYPEHFNFGSFYDHESLNTWRDLCTPIPTGSKNIWHNISEVLVKSIHVVSEQALVSYELVKNDDAYAWQSTGPAKLCHPGTDVSSNPYASTVDEKGVVAVSTNANPYYSKGGETVYENFGDPPSEEFGYLPYTCYACPLGRFRGAADKTTCKVCPEGQYQDQQGQSSCKKCDPGTFTSRNNTVILEHGVHLEVNKKAKQGVECQKCEPNVNKIPHEKYRPFDGSNCGTCGKGTYLYNFTTSQSILGVPNGANFCRECQPGQYSDATGQYSCKKCPAGKAEFLELIPRVPQSDEDSRIFASINSKTKYFEEGPHILASNTEGKHTEWHYHHDIGRNAKNFADMYQPITETKWQWNNGDLNNEFLTKIQNTRRPFWTKENSPRKIISINAAYVRGHPNKFDNPRGLDQCRSCPPGYYQDEAGHSWGNVYYHEPVMTTFANTERTSNGAIKKIEGFYHDKFTRNGRFKGYVSMKEAGLTWPPAREEWPDFYTSDLEGCKKCPRGQYQDEPGSTSGCITCPDGFSTSLRGQATCSLCPSGTFSNNETKHVCDKCPVGYGSVESRALCNECPAGFFSGTKSECKQCEEGTFQSKTGQSECTSCSKGRYESETGSVGTSNGDRHYCTQACAAGYSTPFSGSTNQSQCTVACSAGRYGNGFGCVKCQEGKYNGFIQKSACKFCPKGTYQSDPGGRICLPCNQGKTSSTLGLTNATQCTDCPAGFVKPKIFWGGDHDTSLYQCKEVPKGFHMPVAGKGKGLLCPSGKYSDEPGLTNCKMCPTGQFQDANEDGGKVITDSCIDCPAGRWADVTGTKYARNIEDLHCKPCPVGFYSQFEGATERECAECARGTYNPIEGQKDCERCERGKYQGETGQATCISCQEGKYSKFIGALDDSACIACDNGYTTDGEGAVACDTCQNGYGYNASTNECDECDPKLGLYNDVNTPPVDRGGICRTVVCPTGYGFDADKAKDIPPAKNVEENIDAFCTKCTKGKFRNALTSQNTGSKDVCLDTSIPFTVPADKKNLLQFGQYYSFQPWRDVELKTAVNCDDCGTSLCFRKQNEDGGDVTCRSYNGVPDFSDDHDYFGVGASRCEILVDDIDSDSAYKASRNQDDFCGDKKVGCTDATACNFDPSADFTDGCIYAPENAKCREIYDLEGNSEVVVSCFPESAYIKVTDGGAVKCRTLIEEAASNLNFITVENRMDWITDIKLKALAYENNDEEFPTTYDKLHELRKYARQNMHALEELRLRLKKNGVTSHHARYGWLLEDTMLQFRHTFYTGISGSHDVVPAEFVNEDKTNVVVFGPYNSVEGLRPETEQCEFLAQQPGKSLSECITFNFNNEKSDLSYKYMLGCEAGCWNVFGVGAVPHIRQIGIEKNKYSLSCWDTAQTPQRWTNEMVKYSGEEYTCAGKLFIIGSLHTVDLGGCKDPELNRPPNTISCSEANPSDTDNRGCVYSAPYRNCNGSCVDEGEALPVPEGGVCTADIGCNTFCREEEIKGCMDTDSCQWQEYPENEKPNYGSESECLTNVEYLTQKFPARADDFTNGRADFLDCNGECINDAIGNEGNGKCDEEEVEGCMISGSCNFNPEATYQSTTACYFANRNNKEANRDYMHRDCSGVCYTDEYSVIETGAKAVGPDGICDEEQSSCHNDRACNFNQNEMAQKPISNEELCQFATDNNGIKLDDNIYTCRLNGETNPEGGICLNDVDGDSVCDELETVDCMSENACNFMEKRVATADNDVNLCKFPIDNYGKSYVDCNGTCLNPSEYLGEDGEFLCVEEVVEGCMDTTACFVEPGATHQLPSACEYANKNRLLHRNCDGTCINDVRNPSNDYCDEEEQAGCVIPENEDSVYGIEACNKIKSLEDLYFHNESMCVYSTTDRTCSDKHKIVLAHQSDLELCKTGGKGNGVYIIWPDTSAVHLLFRSENEMCTSDKLLIGKTVLPTEDAAVVALYDDFQLNTTSAVLFQQDATTSLRIDSLAADKGEEVWITDCQLGGVSFRVFCTGNVGCMDEDACTFNHEAHTHDQAACEYYDWCGVCGGDTTDGRRTEESCDRLHYTGCNSSTACNYDPTKRVHDETLCEYPDVRTCLSPCPNEGTCLGECINNEINPDNSLCDEEEIKGCQNAQACNFDSNSTYHDESECVLPYTSESYKYRQCDGTCMFNTVNPDNDLCDEEEVVGCMNTDACNYNPDATLDFGCQPKDCKGFCAGEDYTKTGPNTCSDGSLTCDLSDCCEFRDCNNVCGGTAAVDCKGVCGGNNSVSYTVGDETFEDTTDNNCCLAEERDCAYECGGNKQVDAKGDCKDPSDFSFCSSNADGDDFCDDDGNDPCVKRSSDASNLNEEGYDCANVCNGLAVCTDANDIGCQESECCEPQQRDCNGECRGNAQMVGAVCCPGNQITPTNLCCDQGRSIDSEGNCCLFSEQGCDGICNSGATLDVCGVCDGTGHPEGSCDCHQGTQIDALLVCGGDCLRDEDGDGICDERANGTVNDECVKNLLLENLNTVGLDCSGECNGLNVCKNKQEVDCPGECCLDADRDCNNECPPSNLQLDCNGVCGGGAFLDCDGICVERGGEPTLDTDLDGVCDKDEIVGCMDPSACETSINLEATDADNSLCLYRNQGELVGYECPAEVGEDPTCLDDDGDGVCNFNEIVGCSSSVRKDACTEGASDEANANSAVTDHRDELCRYETDIRNCLGQCKSGDDDDDGLCNAEDVCSTSNPCQNDGACEDIGSNVKCVCLNNWIGNYCEEKKPCTDAYFDCGNGGVDGVSTLIDGCTCLCAAGWQKDADGICTQDKDECDPDGDANTADHPCGFGTCTQDPDEIGKYECTCQNGYSKDRDGHHCDYCPPGYGWDGDQSCVACVYPKAQSRTQATDICRVQHCNGGRGRKPTASFSVDLNPETDNDNCQPCADDESSPSGTIPCQKNVCPNTMWVKPLGERDQTLLYDDVANCVPKTCSEMGFSCSVHGTLTGNPVDGTCKCECGDSGYKGLQCNQEVNECDDQTHECKRGTCINRIGKANGYYECDCVGTGYKGEFCETQINECTETGEFEHQCHADATCTDGASGFTQANDYKGYTCACHTGYQGDGFNCENVDECQTLAAPCQSNAVCTDLIPSENNGKTHDCECKDGFIHNEQTNECLDIPECDGAPCGDFETCVEKEGREIFQEGYVCECIGGYEDNGSGCEDIDECLAGTHSCVELALCSNTAGSHECTCNPGYEGNGVDTVVKQEGDGCVDINHCEVADTPCASDEICFNVIGATEAYCEKTACQVSDLDCVHGVVVGNVGFATAPDLGWAVADQITRDATGCDCDCQTVGGIPQGKSDGFVKRAAATSEFSKNSCTVCPSGDGMNEEGKCEACNVTFVNSQSTYRAVCARLVCDAGYGFTTDWDAALSGTDSDNCVECEGPTTSPTGDGQCAHIQCNPGYKPIVEDDIDHKLANTDQANCEDIRQCLENPCHEKATCHEVIGFPDDHPEGYYCTCNAPWYEGSGKECSHVDSCATSNPCHASYHTCINRVETDPLCADVNECEHDTSVCNGNATCTNLDYGLTGEPYSCACSEGYEGNGEERDSLVCTLIDLCEGVICSGHGTCRQSDGECDCDTGWYGGSCSDNPVDCDGTASENIPVEGHSNRYQGSTCGGVGVCVDGDDDFECLCSGYYVTADDKKSCEVKDLCAEDTCSGRGQCATVAAGVTSCTCNDGYEGDHCESDIDYCVGVNCNGNGVCQDGLTEYTCTCFAGWITKEEGVGGEGDCAVNPDNCPSTNVDVWVSTGRATTAPWYQFYTEADCTSGMPDPTKLQAHTTYNFRRCGSTTSHPFAIQNDGAWTASLTSDSVLTLHVGDAGTQFPWKCTAHPWMNGIFTTEDVGVCRHGSLCVDGNNTHTCDCAGTGYEGAYCQNDVDECASHQCRNGGRCLNRVGDPNGEYDCECVDGFSGALCQIPPDYCAMSGSTACKQGVCSNVQEGYECTCYEGFAKGDGKHCDTCQAGYGWNGVSGSESKCEPCLDGHANALATHSAQCAPQRCRPGYGVVQDSIDFSKSQDANDDDNVFNCKLCTSPQVSPNYHGVCVDVVCGANKIVKDGYDNKLHPEDQTNCVCRNDVNTNGVCDEEETFLCGDPNACNGKGELSGLEAHRQSFCYYGDNENAQYNNPEVPIENLKYADCNGFCFVGFERDTNTHRCTPATVSKEQSVSKIRNNIQDKAERQDMFIKVYEALVEEAKQEEEANPLEIKKTPKERRYESRIPVEVDDLPDTIPPQKIQKVNNILNEKSKELKMVVSSCTTTSDTCSANPTATDDSCVTANLNDDINSNDLTRYVMVQEGCWQVFGTEDGPLAKQTKTASSYNWQCWEDDSEWSTPTPMSDGSEFACQNRTFLTGSSIDVTRYGCTSPSTNTENCNYDPQAQADDGSCVSSDDIYGPGYDCYGSIDESMNVCEISKCTDTELVAAYQRVENSCGETGIHTNRAYACVTMGCNATQLEDAYDILHTGQCLLNEN